MTARAAPIPTYPQPHRRTPDLSGLTATERIELTDFIRRLVTAGGTSPQVIRLTLSPAELDRLKALEAKVAWRSTKGV